MCKSLTTLKNNLEKGSRRLSKVTVKNIVNAKCFDRIELAYSYDGYDIHKGDIIENPIEWFNDRYDSIKTRIYKVEDGKCIITLSITQNLWYNLVIDLNKDYSKETVQEWEILVQQHKESEEKRIQEEKAEIERRRAERENLYNSNVTIEKIENAKIINVEDKNIFVNALEPNLNKNDWKIDNDKEIEKSSSINKYKITDIVKLSEAEYNYFCFNMLNDYDFLTGKGGWEQDEEGNLLHYYAVAIVCEGKETLIVDPSGSSYAKYCNKLIEDINGDLEKELNSSIVIDNTIINNTLELITDTKLYKINASNNRIINDTRIIYCDYLGLILVTGKALKEMIKEGNASFDIKEVKQTNDIIMECILKTENGLVQNLLAKPSPLDNIKFSERLKKELTRAIETEPTPEPPKPTKKQNTKDNNINSNTNNNIVELSTYRATRATTKAKATNTITSEERATKKQLYALHVGSKLNTTNLIISKEDASQLIKKSMQGINIQDEVKQLLKQQQLKQVK